MLAFDESVAESLVLCRNQVIISYGFMSVVLALCRNQGNIYVIVLCQYMILLPLVSVK